MFRPYLIGCHQSKLCNMIYKREIHKLPYLFEIEILVLQNDIQVHFIIMDKNKLK